MKPLKAELDALASVLMTPLEEFVTDKERAEHKDPEGLAQTRMFTQAIEAVDDARGARTMYVVVMRFGVTSWTFLSYGPYATKNQADKALVEQCKLFGPDVAVVVPYRNPEGLAQLVADLDAVPEKRAKSKDAERAAAKKLNRCIHENEVHVRAKAKGIKPVGNVWEIRKREGLE